jgi:hypothetical protein
MSGREVVLWFVLLAGIIAFAVCLAAHTTIRVH